MIEHVVEGCQCEGKQCKKCDETYCIGFFRVVSSNGRTRSECRECERKRARKYASEHADEHRVYSRQYHRAHREECLAGMRRRYWLNVEYHRAYARRSSRRRWSSDPQRWHEIRHRSRLKNREQIRAYDRAYWHENAERLNARGREYRSREEIRQRDTVTKRQYQHRNRARFAGLRRMWRAAYRARKRDSGGTYTVTEWEELKARYDYTCLCCGRREPEIRLTVDHVIPIVLQGKNSIDNIQPLCLSCNSRKQAKVIDYRGLYHGV